MIDSKSHAQIAAKAKSRLRIIATLATTAAAVVITPKLANAEPQLEYMTLAAC